MAVSAKMYSIRMVVVLIGLVIASAVGCGDSVEVTTDDGQDVSQGQWAIAWDDADALPETAAAGEIIEMTAVVTYHGNPMSNVQVGFEVQLGGGSVDLGTGYTGIDGRVDVSWTVGQLPIRQALRAFAMDAPVFVDHVVTVTVDAPLSPVPFGDVESVLVTAGVDASTEGLVFDDSGNLWLAVKDKLVQMDPEGGAVLVPVVGDGLEAPLGLAWDYLRGVMWVADKGSIRKVSISEDPEGNLIATALAVPGLTGLITPNSVALKDNRWVYFTDSCTGGVYRFEPDAATVTLHKVAQFELTTKGGPNGLAFDDSGRLWVTTENVGLLCPDSGADVTLNHGGLYVLDVSGEPGNGTVEPQPRLEGFAMFGDGLGFDRDGNLYVIFDTFDGFTLTDTSVWLVPESTDQVPVKVVSAPFPGGMTQPDRLIANLAWGYDEFGAERMYLSLLAVPLVVAQRGAMVVDVGIPGRSLLPADLPD